MRDLIYFVDIDPSNTNTIYLISSFDIPYNTTQTLKCVKRNPIDSLNSVIITYSGLQLLQQSYLDKLTSLMPITVCQPLQNKYYLNKYEKHLLKLQFKANLTTSRKKAIKILHKYHKKLLKMSEALQRHSLDVDPPVGVRNYCIILIITD